MSIIKHTRSLHRFAKGHGTAGRLATCIAIASTGAIIAAGVAASPAVASTVVDVSSASDLTAALAGPDTHTFIDLTADIDATGSSFVVPASVSIDLEGFTLDAPSIVIGSGATLRILDSVGGGELNATGGDSEAGIFVPSDGGIVISSGIVDAIGGSGAAGIGGQPSTPSGSITINGGTVTATGGDNGGGIGGGDYEGAGDVEINGGVVKATGGAGGAGIGSADSADGAGYDAGSILVLGGSVTAVGGVSAAGIGGANHGSGGVISIGSGAVVTASSTGSGAGHTSAIGGGLGAPGFTSLDISGTVHLPAGELLRVPAGAKVSVHKSGLITGGGASVLGAGTVSNDGTISVGTVDDVRNATPGSLTVTGNDYAITFDSGAPDATPATSTRRVYAASLADASQQFPAVTRAHWELMNWTAPSNAPATIGTTLAADSTFTANWGFSHLVLAPSAGSTPAVGKATTFVATGETSTLGSLGDHTSDVVLTSSNANDTVSGSAITFGSAGPRTITATSSLDSGVTGSILVTVGAGQLASIVISPSTLSLVTGTSHVFTTSGLDDQQNALGAIAATYTSSNSSDVVTASTGSIAFTKTGTRTITAHSGLLTSTATVTVTAGSFGSPTASISGTHTFGHTLTAHVVSPTVSGKKLSYRWYRGSSVISKATKSTYKVTKSDLGKSLKVKVTITASNYTTAVASSAAVAISKDTPTVSIAAPSALGINVSGTVTVTLGAGKSLVKPTGTLKLIVNGKVYKSIAIGSGTGLRWPVTVKFSKKETVTVYASYAGSSYYGSKKSSSKTIKVS